MVYLTTLTALLIVVLSVPSEAGEGLGPTAMDYFMANQNPEIKAAIQRIDNFHTDKVVGWIREGRMNNAIADLEFTLERLPNHPRALLLMGYVGRLTNNDSWAISYFSKALKLFPQHALTHAQYGLYLVDIGKPQIGIEKLKAAIDMDPNLGPAYAWLAKAYSQTNNSDLAREAANQARRLGYKGAIEMGRLGNDKPAK